MFVTWTPLQSPLPGGSVAASPFQPPPTCGIIGVMQSALPQLDRDEIAAFCRRHRIRRLALFGSVLRDNFSPDSDVDVLVEFEPGAKTGLAFFDMQDELSGIIGRKVDLNTPGFLGTHIRERVLRDTQDVYVAA